MNKNKRPLKVAFMLESNSMSINQYMVFKHVLTNTEFNTPIILSGYSKNRPTRNKRKILKKYINNFKFISSTKLFLYIIFLKIINFIEIRKVEKLFPDFKEKKFFDKRECIIHEISGTWSKRGLFFSLDEKSILKIRNINIDIIILFGGGIIKGEIIKIPKNGIINFHHGDNRVNRGGPTGFWEVFNNEKSSGFVIQKINEELDGGTILFRGNIRTSSLWLINKYMLIYKSTVFMKKLLTNLAQNKDFLLDDKYSYLYNNLLLKHDEDPFILMQYMMKIYLPKIKNFIINISYRKKVFWSISFKKNDDLSSPLSHYNEIINPINCYLADPFVITFKGKTICFAEEFNYKNNKGKIVAFELLDNSYKYLGTVLESKSHLSFPFVFEFDNQIFMIPETSAEKQIRLYKCKKFPLEWELNNIMIDNIEAVDSLVIYRNRIWYLLTNICSAGLKENCSELHIFWNKNLNMGKWKPLKKQNPIFFNSEGARNGGILKRGSKLFRISQNHLPNNYGSSFNINEINTLTKDKYVEKFIQEIIPKFKKDIVGTHHFNANGKYSVIDFKRIQKK